MGNWDDYRTCMMCPDFSEVLTSWEGDYGCLVGVINEAAVYCRRVEDSVYELDLLRISDHTRLFTLPQSVRGTCVSVTCHPASGHVAITKASGRTLDLYMLPAEEGQQDVLLRLVQLDYMPQGLSGVLVTHDVIVVDQLDRPILHMHSWSGERLTTVAGRGLRVTEGYILGVGRAGAYVMVVTGNGYPNSDITTVYVFRLR